MLFHARNGEPVWSAMRIWRKGKAVWGKFPYCFFLLPSAREFRKRGACRKMPLTSLPICGMIKAEDLCRRFPGEGTQRRYYSRERYLSRRRGEGT